MQSVKVEKISPWFFISLSLVSILVVVVVKYFAISKKYVSYKRKSVQLTDTIVVLVKDKNGIEILIDPDDETVSRVMLRDRQREQPLQNAIRQIVRPGQRVLVLGGHIGTHTLLISKIVGAEGRVFVFEANPHTIKFLNRNVALSASHNTTVYPKAAYSKNTTLTFAAASSGNTGMSHISNGNDHRIQVEAVAIDSVPEIKQIDVLQMDIEGAESDAVYGAQKLIDNSPNLVVLQEWAIYMMRDQDPDKYLKFWRSRGYEIARITSEGLIRMSDEELKTATHMDIVLTKHLDELIQSYLSS